MKTVMVPYKLGSRGAKKLAEALNIRRVKRENSAFVPDPSVRVINWGCGSNPEWYGMGEEWINRPSKVSNAVNKIKSFNLFKKHGVPCPQFTTSYEGAHSWSKNGLLVVCRTLVGASAGKGIVIADSPHALVEAPLYTQYINKVTEYRVHVFNGKVFHVQEKRKKEDFKNHNELVCNHDNGWVFCIKNVNPSDDVLNAAIAAVSALGMDFGAVDIMVDGDGNPYVLEVNSSPGQEGTTINKYVEMFKEVM